MVPHCYEDKKVTKGFFDTLSVSVPIFIYITILEAYENQNHMFKSIALTHLVNLRKKKGISEENFTSLVGFLDSFRDPYEDFIGEVSGRTWDDIKNNILER